MRIVITKNSKLTPTEIYALIHETQAPVVFVSPDNIDLTTSIPYETMLKIIGNKVEFETIIKNAISQLDKIEIYKKQQSLLKKKHGLKFVITKNRKRRPAKTYGKNKKK